MTRFIDRKTNWSKVVTVALTGASLTAPAFMTASAQADSFHPASGYSQVQFGGGFRDRNRDGFDDRDIDRDGDVDRDIDGDGDIDFNDLNTGSTTVTGIVTQDLNGDRFQIRTNNGETFIVNLRGSGPTSLQEGSRVRVTGLRNGNRITRATVQVLNSGNGNGNGNGYGNGYGNGSMRILQGRVTRDLSGRRFEMTSQGTTYYVTLRRAEPLGLSEGDRVEVYGAIANGNIIQADRVRIISNNGNNGGYNNGGFNNGYNSVNFTGRVINVRSQRRLTVRSDDGTTYDVRSDSGINSQISEGDRVRITGTSRGNSRVINATRIQLRNGNNNGNGNNDDGHISVDFYGRVRSSTVQGPGKAGIIVVETDAGRVWRVQVNDATSWSRGARVHVRGDARNNLVFNNQVDGA